MINNGMSWLSLGSYINPKARNTELSNDYNQLTNRPIITLTGTSQNPIKLWKLDVGLYILNGYVQHTDALLSEARGLFVSATVGIVNGKYVISAFIPFWEGQYEYILPSLSSETYTEHQMIRMITQGNSLTLDNIREYTPSEEYHPSTKKYVDDTIEIMKNELGKMGLNNNDIQSLMKENRRRDIAIQALLSQNSDKMVTIDEEVHNISMDYSLDEGIATINTLEGDTLVNVSKDTEYDKVLSYEQDIVENTNTVNLEVDGNLNPIIVGDTLVNVCTQNNPTAITNEYTVEGSNHFALQDEVEGNCRPIIQGNTIVNRSKTKDITPLTTYVSEVEGNEMNLVDDTDTHVRIDKLVGDTMVNLATNKICPQTRNFIKIADNTYSIDIDKTGYVNQNIWLSLETLQEFKDNTTYTIMFNIIENTLTSDNTTSWTMNFANYTTGAEIGGFYTAKGLIIKKFTTNFSNMSESAKGVKQWQIVIGNMTGGKITIKNPMLFEGDYTDKPIPQEYFEGLKNSYEDGYIEEANDLSFTITGASNTEDRIIYFDDTYVFKPNTTYTIMFDLTIVEESDNMVVRVSTNRGVGSGISINLIKDKIKENHIMRTITTNDYVSTLAIYHVASDPTYGTSFGKVMINKLCILEGDYSSNPLIYEEVMEHGGKYRCEVEVQGKNLFDFNILANKNYTSIVTEDDMECITFKSVTSLESIFDNCNFKQNTSYTLSYDCKYVDLGNGNGYRGTVLGFLYTDGSFAKEPLGCNYDNWMKRKITSDPNKTVKSIIRTFGTSNLDVDTFMKNIQLEEGNTATAYEPYYNQTQTVYLNSPLLKGDEVVYKEGKLCHYHKRGSVVLDGSICIRNGTSGSITEYLVTYTLNSDVNNIDNTILCNTLPSKGVDYENTQCIILGNKRIRIRLLTSQYDTVAAAKQWLQANPTTVVYKLANPYYETISTSELLLPITTNCKLLTSSNIPLTAMSTRVFTEEVNILANTQYSLNFNSDVASTVNITLGGTVLSNQAIVKGYNRLSITTPSTLVDNLLIIEGSGINISEVVVTEYDEGVCEYIEGLKSSFEDGLIPELENLTIKNTVDITPKTYIQIISLYGNATQNMGLMHTKDETFTIVGKVIKTNDFNGNISIRLYNGETGVGTKIFYIDNYFITLVSAYTNFNRIAICVDSFTSGSAKVENIKVFKGDWTHLTEEDFNHLGQYKVEYKVIGKNKFDVTTMCHGTIATGNGVLQSSNSRYRSDYISVKPNTIYTFKQKYNELTNIDATVYFTEYDINKNPILFTDGRKNPALLMTNTGAYGILNQPFTFTTRANTHYIMFRTQDNRDITTSTFQIEEGTVATEYEPYKESIQTVYLNSPLLEGDTIEEIDGEVYHVHRYGKTILNGSEYWCENSYTEQHENKTYIARYSSHAITPKIKSYGDIKCDKVTGRKSTSINYPSANDLMHDNWAWYLILSKNKLSTPDTKGFKQWLSENPITVVYRLAEPIYELIPSSSIVCKSYPNGHLDFDTNVHINNTVNFVKANLPITYANTSTNYKLQFVSDKDMENVTINALGNIMENVTINKGLNKISFTSPSDATNILTFEGLGYAYISNVQLVATDKDIDYFKGLYSTYECGLIEDESNENYGKYEVNIVSYNAPIQFGKGGKIE